MLHHGQQFCRCRLRLVSVRMVYSRCSEVLLHGMYSRCTAGVRCRWSMVYGRCTAVGACRPINYTPWLHLPGSGWHWPARVGSRKRITNTGADQWPLHHGSRRCVLVAEDTPGHLSGPLTLVEVQTPPGLRLRPRPDSVYVLVRTQSTSSSGLSLRLRLRLSLRLRLRLT